MSGTGGGRPDFVILGAMKCGTTTLAAQLGAQPGYFMTDPKEPNFFSDDAIWARGPEWYAQLFAGAAPGDLRGEASTHYTKRPTHPHALDRMRSLLGDAPPRLIYMIRDPVARAVSHYMHGWSRDEITVPLAEAVRAHPELVDYGCYGMQIAPYVSAFGADAILLTSLEAMKTDPEGELARVGAFLGRDASLRAEVGARNVSAERARRLPLHGLLVDNPVATLLRRVLVPKAVRRRIREARTLRERPELPADLRAGMEARFLADRAELARLFPSHPALEACYPFASAAARETGAA
ncbi:sulfotransferase domain-containing protein [Jannaschia sp. W003]|uniref:sulfotransferase domain-containing protein n=1 Tax=Jannaschia sp. W003 TaxID=2867012 RepID=UPI0021A7A881|nr:sulfotransferase domain-containing protein [Jannaschia sp. W003]UWQ23218.1 sulfotransferase domain-containing protein [Jannaschia sp. W003]